MKFAVEGTMALGNETRKFAIEVEALNENMAKERAYNLLGSSSKIKRANMKIEKVEKI